MYFEWHKIEHIRAYVNVVDPNGEVVETMAPAMYCANCKKYYILEREFKSLQKRGLILCKIVDTSYWSNVDTPITKVVGFLFHRVPHDLIRLYHKAIGISLTHSPQA